MDKHETPEIVIETIDDTLKLSELKRGVRILIVSRELFDEVEEALRKSMGVYELIEIKDDKFIVKAGYPENLCRLHKRIEEKSRKLANPHVINLAFKVSTYVGHHIAKTPFQLARVINGTCQEGYKFIYAFSDWTPIKSYIICSGEIYAIVSVDSETTTGVKALKRLCLQTPVTLIVFRIDLSKLESL